MKNYKNVNQVYETTDYTIFKNTKGNRGINTSHVERLKRSFKNEYLMSPIIVNEAFQIIDGQHRYHAAKELNYPINFIIKKGYGLQQIQVYNTNMSNWNKKDYLNMYCDLGKTQYINFRAFMNLFPEFGISACEALLSDATAVKQEKINGIKQNQHYFENGDFEIKDYKYSIHIAKMIIQIKPFYSGFNRRGFVCSMINIFKNNDYDHGQFLERLQANPNSLTHCNNITQYKLLIEDIYNFKSRQKVSLRYS